MLFSVQVLLMCKGKVWFITDQWLGLYSCYPTIPVMQSHAVCAWAALIKCVMTRWLSAILKCEYFTVIFIFCFHVFKSYFSHFSFIACLLLKSQRFLTLAMDIAHKGEVHLIIKWWKCGDGVREKRMPMENLWKNRTVINNELFLLLMDGLMARWFCGWVL